ncbi:mitochondrial genome maintenance exonuclease 1 [Hyla sarda]|uniref:mitochondrial genome maintenance exonuclease 1 n=1 Tax=Hyla sarda TaxID=327740 RepID=UPI0024C3E7CC|nr:mitochondrial genome maintenance exonuclease 1 [Hyla sarda]XP_056423579.1 mitochondrial genome maintenance exonuclease 1 [Hyla sarda]
MLLTMKPLQLLGRNCKRLVDVLPHQLALPLFLSTSCSFLSRNKKVNGYEDVSQEKYADLVRTVTTSKTSCQTPDRIFEEDSFLYGKVLRSKDPSQKSEPKVSQNRVPLNNPNKVLLSMEKTDPKIPVKIGLPGKSQMTNSRLPSVTRILQQTMPMEQAFYLERWKQKMIMELGEEGFIAYTAAMFSQGKLFHAQLEDLLLSGEQYTPKQEDTKELVGYMNSIEHVLSDVVGVKTLESAVVHSDLQYLGFLDCVAKYRGKLCVIDWKTSEKQKPSLKNTFDNPLQVAAYMGAVNHDSNYNFQVDCGLIVIAYKDGSPAHAHFMDSEICLHYWDKWLQRLEEYKEKKEKQ